MLSLFLSHVCPVKVNVNLQLEGKKKQKMKLDVVIIQHVKTEYCFLKGFQSAS